MTIGASDLLKEHGSPLGVAIALLEDRINSYRQQFVREIVPPVMIAAAEAQIRLKKEQLI
jgi:hypothetical protein